MAVLFDLRQHVIKSLREAAELILAAAPVRERNNHFFLGNGLRRLAPDEECGSEIFCPDLDGNDLGG